MTVKARDASQSLGRRIMKYRAYYLFILPALVYVLIFNYGPLYGIQIAFKDYKGALGIMGSRWVGLRHFKSFLGGHNFVTLMKNTFAISIYQLAVGFPIPIILALMLNELRAQRFKKTVQMISYAPHFISTVVICAMLKLFCSRSAGIFNNLVEMLGGARQDMLSNPTLFPHLYVWSGVWQELGWGAIIYLAALSGVSSEMVEASLIDGANRLQVIWYINIPTILPTIVIMLIMRCGSVLSIGFEKVYLMQNALNLDASQIISTYVYEIGLQGGQFSYSAAIGLFNNVVNILILLLVNRICKSVSEIGIW